MLKVTMDNQKSTSKVVNDEWSFDSNQKIWSGPKKPLKYGPGCSLGQVLLSNLLEQDDHICLINCDTGKKYTSREVADMAINIARNLKTLGYKQGEIVGFCGANTDYSGPLSIGVFLSGLAINAVDPNIGIDGIKHMFSITKPSIVFCDGKVYENMKIALQEINLNSPIYTMIDHIIGVPEITEFLKGNGSKEFFDPGPLKEGYLQTACILCSSGTTGPPKAINVTHASLMNFHLIEYLKDNDRFLCFSSLHWISGVFAVYAPILRNSTCLVTSKIFNVDDFLNIARVYRPTVTLTPPFYLAKITASPKLDPSDLCHIKIFICGGCPLLPAVVAKIKPYIPHGQIVNCYGMTEFPFVIIARGYASNNGAIGKLTSNTEIKIIDSDGHSLGPNETGELCGRTIIPFAGYYNNPKANSGIYVDGWILTGDLAFMDDEGNINIVDRKTDIIEFKGHTFFPNDIESIILEIPGVAETCVGAAPTYNSSYVPAIAAIVLKDGVSLSEDYVYKFLNNKIANFGKLEGGIHFVKEIPKTSSGKNLRYKLHYLMKNKSL